jgi:CheY-like chemotaxis protein
MHFYAATEEEQKMKHRILVVEDHEDTRHILRSLLAYHGFEPVEAFTAEEMLARIDTLKPDLIILDIQLPGMDGCAALEVLRERGIETPVFLFSEHHDLFNKKIRSCRPDGFFPKSKGPIELVESIARRLRPEQTP